MDTREAIYDYLIDCWNYSDAELEDLNHSSLSVVYQFAKDIAKSNGELSVLDENYIARAA